MKRSMRATISLILLSFLFVKCTKDQSPEVNTFIGSKWQTTVSSTTLLITFVDSKNVVYSESTSGGSTSYNGTYTFAAPNIRINITDENHPDFEYTGEVSGTVMKLTMGYNGPEYSFQKVN